jgi:TolB-like protein/Flp pilus assembly protein TadD
MGQIYFIQGQYEKAIAEGERSIGLDPNNSRSHALLAQTLRFAGKPEEAIAHTKKAMRLEPYYPVWFLVHLAGPYEMLGRYEEAISILEVMLERALQGEFPPIFIHEWLAINYGRLNRMEEARAQAEEILKIKPDYTVKFFRKQTPYKDQKYLDSLVALLIKTGLPEHPPLPLPDKPSIAVLPFDNLSDDPKQEYFSDGMTDDLITDLSKISGLLVIARNSAFKYKGQAVDVKKVSRELGVRYVLEGSVRRAENMVRINAQLIDATTGGHLWAERYDGQMDDIFSLQDNITQKIVEALALKLTGSGQGVVARKETDNTEAYDAFLQGWEHYRRFTPDDFVKAVSFFETAIELDPNYWRAYAVLASIYWESFQSGHRWALPLGLDWRGAFRQANKYLEIALNNPTPLAHGVATEWYIQRGEHENAIAEAERAIALDSNDPDSHMAMATALILFGSPEEAVSSIKKAMRLDPHYRENYMYRLGMAYFFMGQTEEAVTLCERALKHNPEGHGPLWILIAAYAHLNREQEAKAALAKLWEGNPRRRVASYKFIFKFKDPADWNFLADGLRKAGMK